MKCKLCNLAFKSAKKLQKHVEIFHDESPTVPKDNLICKYCDTVYCDANALQKHTKNDHKIKCDKFFIFSRIKRQRMSIFGKIIQDTTKE